MKKLDKWTAKNKKTSSADGLSTAAGGFSFPPPLTPHSMKFKGIAGPVWLAATACLSCSPTIAAVTVDGSTGSAEGYTHLTEGGFAGPVSGGSATDSDFTGEIAGQYWYDDGAGFNVNLGSIRADIQQVGITATATHLYVTLSGPSIVYNSWSGPDGTRTNEDNDQGDIWLAFDNSGGPAAGSFSATGGPQFANEGARGVDFLGWQPTHFAGVQYVNNGGGGSGYAALGAAGGALTGEGHGLGDGGFDWQFDPSGLSYEFAIPWSSLGGAPAPGAPFRLAAYTTHNFGGLDTYDSGPGIGNGGPFEQLGDFKGDSDSGLPGVDTASDGAGLIGAFPGSNSVSLTGYTGPGSGDEVDTIQGYYTCTPFPVPEPTGLALLGCALFPAFLRRR